jgi:hypothetical protein
MRKELTNLKTSDAKEYWKLLNRSREKKNLIFLWKFFSF